MAIQKSPFVVEEQPRKIAWCACGQSEKGPYCDGSHSRKNTGKSPVIVELAQAKKIAWCGCRQSANKPYCDGAHSRIK